MLCPWEPAQYLIFSSNVPTLLYYSHFVGVIAAILFAAFLFPRAKESLVIKVFLLTITSFIAWAIIDVLLWASNDPGLVLFYWGIQILLEMVLYISSFYFGYLFITQKDLRFTKKVFLTLLIAPIALLLPTNHLLPAIDASYCDAVETNFVIFYSYASQILIALSILFVAIRQGYRDPSRRREVSLFVFGILIFLIAFSSGNIIGSVTEDWVLAQYGLFGMPIFTALLAFLVVRYKAFNTKIIGAQALVLALWVLIGSLLFVVKTDISRIISLLTLIISIVFGVALIRSVKKEVALREELQEANKRQQETLRFITHEVKGYLTDGAAALDAILTETFGPVAGDMKTMVGDALTKNRMAVREIQNFLRIADFKTGKVSYAVDSFDMRTALTDMLVAPGEQAKTRGLAFSFTADEGSYTLVGDKDQLLNHVFGNLVHNAINYTPAGSVSVRMSRERSMIRIAVKDTGVGLSDDDKAVLFTEGGHGKESRTVNPHSTGYGLFIAKRIVDAHHGRIWAESEGRGTGSTFIVELPATLSKKDFGLK